MEPQYKKKTVCVEISIYIGTTLGLHNIQDLSRIPQKYHKNTDCHRQYTHPKLICRGHTDGRTD
jgi:hypothetical protein